MLREVLINLGDTERLDASKLANRRAASAGSNPPSECIPCVVLQDDFHVHASLVKEINKGFAEQTGERDSSSRGG